MTWTNGTWYIEQANEDEVMITGPFNQKCYIDGGDLESMLSAMCAVRKHSDVVCTQKQDCRCEKCWPPF